MVGRLFRLSVDTVLALCNHSLTFVYVDVSMRRHRVKERRKLLTNQTSVIVDITITTHLFGRQNPISAVSRRSVVTQSFEVFLLLVLRQQGSSFVLYSMRTV
jgi:hypothetical protein